MLNAPSEASPNATATNPYDKKVDMSIVEKNAEKKPVEISRSKTGTSTVVSNKPIVSKTTEGYQSIYRSTSETIMPFIPVICLYFGDGLCPKAFGEFLVLESRAELFKHRDNQDYLNINQIPYFLHIFNRMENSIKWEHRSIYGVLLFNKFMNHSIHNNLVNLDYSRKGCSRALFARQQRQRQGAEDVFELRGPTPAQVPEAEVAELGGKSPVGHGHRAVLQGGAQGRVQESGYALPQR